MLDSGRVGLPLFFFFLLLCISNVICASYSPSSAAAETDDDSPSDSAAGSNSDVGFVDSPANAAFGAPVQEYAAWRGEDSNCRDGTFANLQSFVQFMGYPRSGHTLIAMLLDAHPDVVLSNEINILKKWHDKFDTPLELEMLIVNKVLSRYDDRRVKKPKKHAKNEVGHYNYRVPGAWQGRWRCLRVIGDKKGSSTTAGLQRDWNGTVAKFDWLRANVGVPVKLFHVIRNPFDNIATMIGRGLNVRTHNASDHLSLLADAWDDKWMSRVERWIGLFTTNMQFARTLSPADVLHVHDYQLLRNATHETQRWCRFLDLDCPPRYSAAVERILYRSPWRSRHRIPWSSRAKRRIEEVIRSHEILGGYTFDGEN